MYEMMIYELHELPEFITVNALVSVYRVDMELRKTKKPQGKGDEAHNFPELVYVEKGEFNVNVDSVPFSLREGQCLIYPPCAYHASPTPSNAVVDIIGFNSPSPALSQIYNRVMNLDEKLRKKLTEIMSIGQTSFKDAPLGHNMSVRKNADIIRLHKLKNSLELFLIDLYEAVLAKSKKNDKNYKLQQFDEVTAYLKTNIDKNLSLSEIASNCGMSVPKLKMLFAEQSELSPVAYFISLKIEKAKELIANTSLNFTQISEMLGFKTLYYFSDRFKQKTGMSPSEYAKTL